MATPKIVADFETQLATALSVGDTSFTLASATDDDGVALPAGKYYFTIDNGKTTKEYVVGTVSGTSVTSVSNVTRQGTESSGVDRAHRVGASVIISDFLTYKNYIDETTVAGAADADTNTKGVVEGATLAEVRARTATGSTGAALVITPDVADDMPTSDEKAAMAGGGDLGTPSTSNKYMTQTGLDPAIGDLYDAVTFPVVEATATNSANNSSSISQTAPAGTTAGDLLLIFIGSNNGLSSIGNGYTEIGTATAPMHVYAKIATGTDTFTATNSTSVYGWATTIYRISNYWGSSNVTDIVKGEESTAQEEPPLLNPENRYSFYRWFAAVSHINTGTYSAAPTGYSDLITTYSTDGDSGQAGLAVATKTLRAIEENPDAFTESGTTNNSQAVTVSVKAAESNYNI